MPDTLSINDSLSRSFLISLGEVSSMKTRWLTVSVITLAVIVVALFLYIAGILSSDYPAGKDTTESFSDGRFQILRTPTSQLLYDAKTKEVLFSDIVQFRRLEGQIVFHNSSGDGALLTLETGNVVGTKSILE